MYSQKAQKKIIIIVNRTLSQIGKIENLEDVGIKNETMSNAKVKERKDKNLCSLLE